MASANTASVPDVQYDKVKEGSLRGGFVLLDVRNAEETVEGMIPNAKSLPVTELEAALLLNEASFLEKYRFSKPGFNDEIVTYCRLGGRALKAAELLKQNKYTNVSRYLGSWKEWSEKHPEHVNK